MNITVLGCGRWGTFLAWYFNSIGYNVLLWGRSTSEKYKKLQVLRENDYVKLENEIILTNSLSYALEFSDKIFIAIKEQSLRNLMETIVSLNYHNKTFILCMKGIENITCKRLSDVAYEYVGGSSKIATMLGPGQPSDIVKGIPTCMLIDSFDDVTSKTLAKMLSSNLICIKSGNDLIGNEIGSAINKLVGIAGGMLDEMGYSSLKGPLMVAATKEISKLIEILGGNPSSAYGLCCLGDYQASIFSEHSNSVAYGRTIVKKTVFQKHTPGAYTAKTIIDLINNKGLHMPLLMQISKIITNCESAEHLIDRIKTYVW